MEKQSLTKAFADLEKASQELSKVFDRLRLGQITQAEARAIAKSHTLAVKRAQAELRSVKRALKE